MKAQRKCRSFILFVLVFEWKDSVSEKCDVKMRSL